MRVLVKFNYLFCSIILICITHVAQAQDLIVKKNGEVLCVYNIDIADKWVYYTSDNAEDSELKRILKDEVFSVKIGDDNMQTIDAAQPSEKTEVNANMQKAAGNNEDLMALYNQPSITGFKKMKPNDKDTKTAFAVIRVGKESVLSNSDLEVSFEKIVDDRYVDWLVGYHIYIKNKTDHVLYVDLGNTFRILNSGASRVYFDGSQVTQTKGSGRGSSVNLGAIANGVGVGGTIGAIASGINVGGGSQSSSSQTFGNQRVLPIPPMGKISLPPIYRPTKKDVAEDYDCFQIHLPADGYQLKRWHFYDYDEDDSPWTNQFIITYSKDADFSTCSNIKFSFYIGQLISVPDGQYASYVYFEDQVIGYNSNMIISHVKIKDFSEIKDVKYIDREGAVAKSIYY